MASIKDFYRARFLYLFHYDSEEFRFRDRHLLLRGNNGTGKSKVLSLTLPFLFDAQLKSSRIEPDGDADKKMAWNLLLGKHERRIGYIQTQVVSGEAALLRERTALEELQLDPIMRDARRLDEIERQAQECGRDTQGAISALQGAEQRHGRQNAALQQCTVRADTARTTLAQALAQADYAAGEVGLAARDDYTSARALLADVPALAHTALAQYGTMQHGLRALVVKRRVDLVSLQRRVRALEAAERERTHEQGLRNERADELGQAAAQVAEAELGIGQCGTALVDAWQNHCSSLPGAESFRTRLAGVAAGRAERAPCLARNGRPACAI